MIFTLRGKLIAKSELFIIVEVLGIGYGVFVSMNSLASLPDIDKEVFLYIHQIIREDSHVLYGFLYEKEKFLFCELIKITGLGGRLALTILSHLTVDQLIEIITAKNLTKLTNIPGIGQKTAQRIMIDMQNIFQHKKTKELFAINNKIINNNIINNNQNLIIDNIITDVQEALVALGYKAKDAISIVKKIVDIDIKDNNQNNHYLTEKLSAENIVGDCDVQFLNNKNKMVEELLKKSLKQLANTNIRVPND